MPSLRRAFQVSEEFAELPAKVTDPQLHDSVRKGIQRAQLLRYPATTIAEQKNTPIAPQDAAKAPYRGTVLALYSDRMPQKTQCRAQLNTRHCMPHFGLERRVRPMQ